MPIISIEGVAASAAVLVAAVTYVLTSMRSRGLDRASMVRQYSSDFANDPDVVRIFVEIDYERFRFDQAMASWLGQAPEIHMVRMLDLFNSLGHSWSRHLVKLDDIHGTTLGYAILRAHHDPYVRKYLAYVDGHDFDHLGTGAAFEFFRRLAVQLDSKSKRARAKRRKLQRSGKVVAQIDGETSGQVRR
jgi:hypothetical protein